MGSSPDTGRWGDDYSWEDENEQRLWYCEHGKAYGIRCSRCEEME